MIDSAERPLHDTASCGNVDALFCSLYDQLRRIARREVWRNGARDVLGTATLVHEAWLDLRESDSPAFAGPGQFLSYAGRMMRGLAIDRMRSRQAQRRGGDRLITSLDTETAGQAAQPQDWQALRDALEELEAVEQALAEVVDLKFFCGFTLAEIAAMRGVSERTVQRQWEKARSLLYKQIHAQ